MTYIFLFRVIYLFLRDEVKASIMRWLALLFNRCYRFRFPIQSQSSELNYESVSTEFDYIHADAALCRKIRLMASTVIRINAAREWKLKWSVICGLGSDSKCLIVCMSSLLCPNVPKFWKNFLVLAETSFEMNSHSYITHTRESLGKSVESNTERS